MFSLGSKGTSTTPHIQLGCGPDHGGWNTDHSISRGANANADVLHLQFWIWNLRLWAFGFRLPSSHHHHRLINIKKPHKHLQRHRPRLLLLPGFAWLGSSRLSTLLPFLYIHTYIFFWIRHAAALFSGHGSYVP